MNERRLAGVILVVLGVLALREGYELFALRTDMLAGAVVGDDTFPLIVGGSLLLVGAYTLVLARWPIPPVNFPAGEVRHRMLGSAGALIGYFLIMPYLGYSISTLLGSMALFKIMGAYRWWVAILLSGLTTGALYLMFRVWLLQPLPGGWVGI